MIDPGHRMVYSCSLWLTLTIGMVYSCGWWLTPAIGIQNKFTISYVGLAFAPSTTLDFHLPNNNFTKEKLKETIKGFKTSLQ